MKVLILVTGASRLRLLDGNDHASGFWAEEFVVPYERFIAEGYDVDVATVGGVAPTVDPGSLDPTTLSYTRPSGSEEDDAANAEHYRAVIESLPALKDPLAVEDLPPEALEGYDGVYISGGHGAMEDMPRSYELALLLNAVLKRDMPLGVVCHGQAGLLALRDSHGRWPLEGRRMTMFSHEEELVTEMVGRLPFVLQFELERLGAKAEHAPVIWGSHVVEDGNLISGQNPYSSAAIADAFVKRLSKKSASKERSARTS